MKECVICQHAKIEAIDAALTSGRLVPVVAIQFRVNKIDLLGHLKHAPTQAMGQSSGVIGLTAGGIILQQAPEQARTLMVERPLTRFKHAWQDAKDDRAEQQRMLIWLNEQLQSDDMGLP